MVSVACLQSNRSFGKKFLAIVVICSVVNASQLWAQDLEKIADQKVVAVGGGVSTNSTFYDAQGIENRRDPFYWMMSANLNFNILGVVQAPFSMTVSQQDKKFAQPQPFNRFGISPKYKSITGHFGHRSMTFSEYTLAGSMFLGAGVEVTPQDGFFRVSAMYGQLAKAVERTAQEGLVFAKPTFRRIGYGVKLGLGRKKNMVDLILFKGKDDPNSITLTEDLEVTPEENLVGAIHSKHELSGKVAVEIEYAYSLLTRDTRTVETSPENYSFFNNLGGLFKPNMSSEFNKAITTTLNYNGERYQANLKYRNVDPGYRTLGSSFLNNGLKDITGGVSTSVLQQKINISTNAGVQKSTNETSMVRVIYTVNVTYNSSKRLTLNTSYSNFSTTTRQTQIQRDVLIDTLEYFQVTRNAAVNLNYKLGSGQNERALLVTANVQDATDSDNNASTFYTLTVGHQMKINGDWQFVANGSYNKNMAQGFTNTSIGPSININKAFNEGRVRSALNIAMLNSYMNGSKQSDVKNIGITNNLKVGKSHSFAINVYYLQNKQTGELGKTFSEIRGMFNYNYNF
jgi:hypothetical protein